MTTGQSDNPLGERLWSFSEIGYLLRYLEGVTAGYPVTACPDDDNRFVLENIRELLEALNEYEFGEEEELSGWVEALADFADELERKRLKRMGPKRTEQLHRIMAGLIPLLREEMNLRTAFVALPIRDLNVEQLIIDPEEAFGLNLACRPPIPGVVTRNVREAGRCLAVGFDSAAGMFLCLAAESVLRYYYIRITGEDNPGKSTWGALLDKLKIPALGCPKRLLDNLNRLKETRNDFMHGKPEIRWQSKKVLWNQEVTVELFKECRAVVGEVMEDLRLKGKISIPEPGEPLLKAHPVHI